MAVDDFNRGDSASMGANWTTCTGTNLNANGFKILSGAAVPESNTVDSMEIWNADSFSADQYAECACTVTGTNAGTGPGPFVRGTSGVNPPCYRATVMKAASNNVEVLRQVGTTYTTIEFRTTTWVDGDILRLEVQGSTLRVYQNGVQLGADMSDGALASGNPGIIYSSTTTSSSLDNWQAGNLVTGPAPTLLVATSSLRW